MGVGMGARPERSRLKTGGGRGARGRSRRALLVCLSGALSCGVTDLGDNIVPPDLQLDEDFFYCRIQPEVLSAAGGRDGCAGGGPSEGGMCHTARSSLRLTELDAAQISCDAGVPVGALPVEATTNLEAVRFTVQSDPLSSPLYRRPTGLDSHPRVLFDEASPEAALIVEWINGGSR